MQIHYLFDSGHFTLHDDNFLKGISTLIFIEFQILSPILLIKTGNLHLVADRSSEVRTAEQSSCGYKLQTFTS